MGNGAVNGRITSEDAADVAALLATVSSMVVSEVKASRAADYMYSPFAEFIATAGDVFYAHCASRPGGSAETLLPVADRLRDKFRQV